MKSIGKICLIVTSFILIACGGNTTEKKSHSTPKKTTKSVTKPKKDKKKKVPASKIIDLKNKGIGPIQQLDLNPKIDNKLAKQGENIFTAKCKACHKVDKKFIGPSIAGVTKRRSPEWIMNMILNPNNMVLKDPLAKRLLMEFNGAPMANQNLSKVFEYSSSIFFR